MSRREPAWWYDDTSAAPLPARLLAPAAALVAHIAEQRFQRAKPFKVELPVICVGNFTAGGTGKTPMTRLLLDRLRARGETPAVLSRGYGGTLRGPVEVDPAQHTARDVGDEPLLHAATTRTVIARDRAAGAQFIASLQPPPSVIVMDDGLQNPGLEKTLSFALVDAARGLGNGRVIPAGPLRARLAFQLGLADAIVITGTADELHETRLRNRLAASFSGPILRARPAPRGDTAWIQGAPLAAFAGIAAPHRFFALLETLGGRLVATEAFADHSPFSEADCTRLLASREKTGAVLITTEKDLVRLRGAGPAAQRLAQTARVLPIGLVPDEPSAALLEGLLDQALVCNRREP